MELIMEHVVKQYHEKRAINDVSFHLTPGVYGLIGENGAGKTTLMNMICGVLTPTSGLVLYDGNPIAESGEAYRALVGYLPQEFGVLKEFTVIDYLFYIATLKGVTKTEAKKMIAMLADELTLNEYLKKRIYKLSGGTKRRVGVAQALLNDPSILVLDEPTAGLDPGERVRFQKLLANLARDRIVLISTHIVSDVEYLSSCNIFLKQGQVLMTGTTEKMTALLEGKLWSISLPYPQLAPFENAHMVLKSRNENGREVEVRFFSKTPVAKATPVVPGLEDVYLWAFHQNHVESGVI